MKVTKIRLQQTLMTAGCIVFLVWVGIRGQRVVESDKSTDKKEEVVKAKSSLGLSVQTIKDEVITMDKVYEVRILNYPQLIVRSTQSGEISTIKVEENSWVEAGTTLLELKGKNLDGENQSEEEIVKYAELIVKEKLEQLQQFNQLENRENQQEKLKQYTQEYNQAKSDLELAIRYLKNSQANGVNKTVVATKSGAVQRILVHVGDKVETNQPLIETRNTKSKLMQLSMSSEEYLLMRDNLNIVKAIAISEDHSRLDLPTKVLQTLSQRSINENGEIDVFLDLGTITNADKIVKVEFAIPQIEVKVVPSSSIEVLDGMNYVWMVDQQNKMLRTPVVVVKKAKNNAYIRVGKDNYNKVLVGDLSSAKEGEVFSAKE